MPCEFNAHFIRPASPAARFVPQQPFNPDSGSLRCLDMAASWISTCAHHHCPCATDEVPPVLPSRVLDLGRAGDMIKLVDGSGRSARYACLSYRVSMQLACSDRATNLPSLDFTKTYFTHLCVYLFFCSGAHRCPLSRREIP